MITVEQMQQERAEADAILRGFNRFDQPSRQCEGKPMPTSPKPVKLSHIWWVGSDTLVVEPCHKPTCTVCGPKADLDLYGITQP